MELKEHDYAYNPFDGHPDKITDVKGRSYFFLGNGLIQVAIQYDKSSSGTPLGLLIMNPAILGHKSDAFSFDKQFGLERTMIEIDVDGKTFLPQADNLRAKWFNDEIFPVVEATWNANSLAVTEQFLCHDFQTPSLIRKITIKNNAPHTIQGNLIIDLNISKKESYEKSKFKLNLSPNEDTTFIFQYQLENNGTNKISIELLESEPSKNEAKNYWMQVSSIDFGNPRFNHLFTSSRNQIISSIAQNGKMNASTWQYNLEWVRDASYVAIACLMAGHFETARRILSRLIDKFVDTDGSTIDSSRKRPLSEVELDQNGILLYAIWQYWHWTGDKKLIEKNWEKIKSLANFPLQDIYWDKESKLLKNCRESWERHEAFGVTNGYEITYQLFPILGLEKAAEMALELGEKELADKWQNACDELKNAFLYHPKFFMIHNGRFIKRRKESGEVHLCFEPPDKSKLNDGAPLKEEKINEIEPDSVQAYPIIFEMIDPKGEIATKTLEHIETIWNQRWDYGGYPRYNVSSEADVGGPWPLATMIIARAYLENGNSEKVLRILNWMYDQSPAAGTWLEFIYYDFRPSPPMPPLGVIPWAWAEVTMFFVHHLLGIRPGKDNIIIRPRLLKLTNNVEAKIRTRDHFISLKISRQEKNEPSYAIVNQEKMDFCEQLVLPYIAQDYFVEIYI